MEQIAAVLKQAELGVPVAEVIRKVGSASKPSIDHEVIYHNDPELIYASDGVLAALTKAKQQGKVRFVGFNGHKHPAINLEMFNRG